MDLSVVIVSFNTKRLLDECLASLYKSLEGSPLKFEVIVVDNVSTDGTREMLSAKYPQAVTILNDENIGFGRANNQGIRKSRGSTVFLLNSDTIVQNGSVEKLYEFSRRHPKAFVGPKLYNIDRTPQTSCGPFFTPWVVFAVLFLKGDRLKITRWSPNRTTEVDWVSGAALMGPRDLFLDDLLFDEKIFMYMEEIDLLYRARRRGIRTYFLHTSHIIHLGSGSSTNRRKGPVLNIFRGFVYFYGKHYPRGWQLMLKLMLKTKAAVAVAGGMLMGDQELKSIYAEAYRIV
jgi:GT2 family glycosyltransferase